MLGSHILAIERISSSAYCIFRDVAMKEVVLKMTPESIPTGTVVSTTTVTVGLKCSSAQAKPKAQQLHGCLYSPCCAGSGYLTHEYFSV